MSQNFYEYKKSPLNTLDFYKLKSEGKNMILDLFEKIAKNNLLISMIFILAELILILSSIITVRFSNIFFNINIFFLLTTLISQVFFYFFFVNGYTSDFLSEKLSTFLSLPLLAYRKGISNLPPLVLDMDNWIGVKARAELASKKLTANQGNAFMILKSEWNGSLEDLISFSRKI